jgi:tryptophan-rich sensory protein
MESLGLTYQSWSIRKDDDMITALRGFLPWIGFGIVASAVDWRFGVLVALVLAAAALISTVLRGATLDQLVIELSGTAFFLVLTPLAFLDPHSVIQHDTAAIAGFWLAATSWGSQLVGRPFTLGIAKLSVDREHWDRPEFRQVNSVITTVWSVAFTLQAVGLQLFGAHTAADIALQVAGYAVPMIFTVRYGTLAAARGETMAAAERVALVAA